MINPPAPKPSATATFVESTKRAVAGRADLIILLLGLIIGFVMGRL